MLSNLRVRYLVQNQYIFGVATEKILNLSAQGVSSPKYCNAVAEKAITVFLGSKNVLNLVYFRVFCRYAV